MSSRCNIYSTKRHRNTSIPFTTILIKIGRKFKNGTVWLKMCPICAHAYSPSNLATHKVPSRDIWPTAVIFFNDGRFCRGFIASYSYVRFKVFPLLMCNAAVSLLLVHLFKPLPSLFFFCLVFHQAFMCFLTARTQSRPSVANATVASTSPTGTGRCAAASRSCATQVGACSTGWRTVSQSVVGDSAPKDFHQNLSCIQVDN